MIACTHSQLEPQRYVYVPASLVLTSPLGVDFDLAVVDEAAFVNSALLREGIFPVLMKQRSAVVMATTPSEKPTSLFMELIRHVDDKGNTRMYVVRSGQPCKPCMRSAEPWMCTHTLDERPHWKDKGKEERLRYLYSGAADTFAREQLGAVIDDSVRPFLPRHVHRFQQRPLVATSKLAAIPCAFLLVDSASGGACEFAIVGIGFLGPLAVVLYLDAFSGKDASDMSRRRARIQHAATTIHNMPGLNEPPIVSVVENAPGVVGPEMHEHLIQYPWVRTMQEWTASSDIYGVPPHPPIRDRQVGRMETRLAQDMIAFAECCSTYPSSLGGQPLEKLKTKLGVQLMGMERVVEYNRNKPLAKPKVGWSAKQSAGNDDLAIAAIMMDWAEVFFSSDREWRYGDWIREWVAKRMHGSDYAVPELGTVGDKRSGGPDAASASFSSSGTAAGTHVTKRVRHVESSKAQAVLV